MTQSDIAIRDRKLAFHTSQKPPVVQRYVMEGTVHQHAHKD